MHSTNYLHLIFILMNWMQKITKILWKVIQQFYIDPFVLCEVQEGFNPSSWRKEIEEAWRQKAWMYSLVQFSLRWRTRNPFIFNWLTGLTYWLTRNMTHHMICHMTSNMTPHMSRHMTTHMRGHMTCHMTCPLIRHKLHVTSHDSNRQSAPSSLRRFWKCLYWLRHCLWIRHIIFVNVRQKNKAIQS